MATPNPRDMLALGAAARQAHDAHPPEIEQWKGALEGCAKLFQYAAQHLDGDRPNYPEAARCIAQATQMGADLHPQVVLAYIGSGAASNDFLQNVRDSLER